MRHHPSWWCVARGSHHGDLQGPAAPLQAPHLRPELSAASLLDIIRQLHLVEAQQQRLVSCKQCIFSFDNIAATSRSCIGRAQQHGQLGGGGHCIVANNTFAVGE